MAVISLKYSNVEVDSGQERGGHCTPLSCPESTSTRDKERYTVEPAVLNLGGYPPGLDFPQGSSIGMESGIGLSLLALV